LGGKEEGNIVLALRMGEKTKLGPKKKGHSTYANRRPWVKEKTLHRDAFNRKNPTIKGSQEGQMKGIRKKNQLRSRNRDQWARKEGGV